MFYKKFFNADVILPVAVNALSLFVSHMFHDSFAPSTIATYLSAIGYVHKVLGFQDPSQSFLVQQLVHGAQRLRPKFDTRLPITVNILNRLLDAVPVIVLDSYEVKLVQAIFVFAFSVFARVGELVVVKGGCSKHVLQLNDLDLEFASGKIHKISVNFKSFKHHYSGASKIISFSHGDTKLSALHLMLDYLQHRHKQSGQLFCLSEGQIFYRSYFDTILHRCLAKCGLDSSMYKGHSFRIGAASLAAEKGLSDSQIRLLGRWNSNAFKKYIRVPIINT